MSATTRVRWWIIGFGCASCWSCSASCCGWNRCMVLRWWSSVVSRGRGWMRRWCCSSGRSVRCWWRIVCRCCWLIAMVAALVSPTSAGVGWWLVSSRRFWRDCWGWSRFACWSGLVRSLGCRFSRSGRNLLDDTSHQPTPADVGDTNAATIAINQQHRQTIRHQHRTDLPELQHHRRIHPRPRLTTEDHHLNTIHLFQPQQLAEQDQHDAQPNPIIHHRTRVVADMIAQIQQCIEPTANPARTQRENRAHTRQRQPVREQNIELSHDTSVPLRQQRQRPRAARPAGPTYRPTTAPRTTAPHRWQDERIPTAPRATPTGGSRTTPPRTTGSHP
jgi:hypothetical protein